MSNTRFVQNAIWIPSKDKFLVSTHVHDFVQYTHDDGKYIFIDGGPEYHRCGGHSELFAKGIVVKCWINPEDSFETKASLALWGTRGKNGKNALVYRPIKSFSRGHLRAIRKNCKHAHPEIIKIVSHWLKTKYKE